MPTPLELLEEQVKSGLIQGGVAASSRSEKIAAAGQQTRPASPAPSPSEAAAASRRFTT